MEMALCNGTLQVLSGQLNCLGTWQVVDSTQTELLVAGGFDPELFGLMFVSVLLLNAVGMGTGLIVSQLRKLRMR